MVDFCSPPKKLDLPSSIFSIKSKKPYRNLTFVSCCEGYTENFSQFIDYWLQPIMKALPSFVEDTTLLINGLSNLRVETNYSGDSRC